MWTLQVTLKKYFVINHAQNMRDRKNVFFFKSRTRDPVLKL